MTFPAFAGVAPGTCIMTAAGEVPVEGLRPSDRVLAVIAARLVRVCNVRRGTAGPIPAVRILAGAFGDGRPVRDLHVSLTQPLLANSELVAAGRMVNGGTITYANTAGLVWLAVELDHPDAVLADGMPLAVSALAPPIPKLLKPSPVLDVLPRQFDGFASRCEEVSAGLPAPATLTDEPEVHLLADGVALWPEGDGAVLCFRVSPGCASLRLVSRTGVPARTNPGSTDQRQLGIAVDRLRIDGRSVMLDDPVLTLGWHRPDGAAPRLWRWTSGDAVLPPGETVEIGVAGVTRYSVEPPAEARA